MSRSSRLKVVHVVGARPNFMKAAPVMRALESRSTIAQMLVHTGQHYDDRMSDVFFRHLGLAPADLNLEVGSASHAVQTAEIMMRFEKVVLDHQPDWICVYGDVNSTMACALVAAKLGVKVAHVEAGLRSHDWTMPEEINRAVTDRLSDVCFTPSADANANLIAEGVPPERIHLVGNCMIDTLVRLLPEAVRPPVGELRDHFILVTLHRPSNVDEPSTLRSIMGMLETLEDDVQVVFPAHPRTRKRLNESGLAPQNRSRVLLTEPVGYLESLWLQKHAVAVVTDSGGLQEETTYLGVPCFTLRDNTERPITCEEGTNTLIGRDMDRLRRELGSPLAGRPREGRVPPLWDGMAG